MLPIKPLTAPAYEYVAYIDEAGDPGLNKVRPIDPSGASEWLTVGAILARAKHEANLVSWVKDLRRDVRDNQGPALHFRRMSDERRKRVAIGLAKRPVAGFAVISHKPNMKGWRNPAAEAVLGPRGWFYNWCVRLLLERVTDCAEKNARRVFGGPRYIKFVFSERGGVEYGWLRAYIEVLKKQAQEDTTLLTKREVRPYMIHPDLIEVTPGNRSAGCQLADVVASAFHCAADSNGRRWNTDPAEALRPIMPEEDGFCFDYSVCLQPTPAWRAAKGLSLDQKKIFRAFHYDI